MKQSSLELGGSDPFVVLDDADLSEIQKIIGGARLYNAGQVCTSSKRFIVTEKNYDKIVEMLKEKGMGDVLVLGGGVIPDADIPGLKAAGIAEVFTPGTPTSAVIDFIKAHVK